MDVKYLTGGLVALIVTVIIVATVAVPIVNDASQGTPYQGSNAGADVRYTDASGKAVTWTWNGTGSVTIGGVSGASPNAVPAVISDKIILRTSSTGMYWYDLTSSTYATVHGTSNTATLTVAANGAYTFTIGETTKTGTISKILISTADGNIGHFTSGARATIGETVYIGNWGSTETKGPVRFTEFVNGTEGASWFSPWELSEGTIVAGDPVTYDVDYSTVGEGQQVGMYSGCTTTAGDVSTTEMQIYAPIDYHSTAVEGPGGINQTLLAVVPLLLFIVAIMVAVRLIKDA